VSDAQSTRWSARLKSASPGIPLTYPRVMDELVARLRAAGCVFAEDEARILTEAADGDAERLEELATARVGGLPLEHLVGWAELDGRRWLVAPGVFVPRQRSELLVREAATRAAAAAAEASSGSGAAGTALGAGTGSPLGDGALLLVDLCCGCGALGGAVAARLLATGHDVEVHAADVDPAAVTCAHANLKALADASLGDGRLTAHTYTGDLADPLPAEVWGRVDVLVANAPYVPTAAISMMPPEAREHEPHVALDGGGDGLAILRRVIDLAPKLLRPGGHLLVETGEAQVSAAVGHMTTAGLTTTVLSDEDLGATALAATLRRGRTAAR
jgi:release factor glutamine methyltransferase